MLAVLVVIGVVWASQLVLVGQATSWWAALGSELAFWFSWSVVALLVFRICRFLHAGPQERHRYVIALSLGAMAALLAFPLLFQALLFASRAVAHLVGFDASSSAAFWPTVWGTILNLLGPTLVLYVGTVFGWYAVTFYRDLRERQLKALELESLLRQAQLEALRSQLHPHFLFNTLHSIAELVHENPSLAEQLILRLANLLRKVLKTPARQEVPLKEEVEFIRDYLEIEQMRLGDRLRVEWEVDSAVLEAQVPSLVLQPLIENAIQHGIAALARSGRLAIRARRDAEYLHLQVQDTGPGLQAETVEKSGIGLANTEDRLKRLYGSRYQFELVNHQGLTVNVRIPFVMTNAPSKQSSGA